jgi:hypothetical protein
MGITQRTEGQRFSEWCFELALWQAFGPAEVGEDATCKSIEVEGAVSHT